ncbi:hypothetical protein I5Q34_04950 [Streptomyces sp. AV19]|uniref:hypothetical protein n=1 Tax=Streptomyces sp. AV19 TaxID=2793068 RepID=UPI0018FEA6AA|nr:hypothetical protein [Streptomyces sp. AV19]MBH1933647.1 hypothetical protein [Streptomyces sp. AV19]MDG4535847.1 hypothetical protein [Streptomyces sp. AV19]
MRKQLMTLAAVTFAAAAPLVLASAGTAAAAENVINWSAQQGDATASGTRWTEKSASGVTWLVAKGELVNASPGCVSMKISETHDFLSKTTTVATQCGPGTSPVGYRAPRRQLMSYIDLYLCEGDQDTRDCKRAKETR